MREPSKLNISKAEELLPCDCQWFTRPDHTIGHQTGCPSEHRGPIARALAAAEQEQRERAEQATGCLLNVQRELVVADERVADLERQLAEVNEYSRLASENFNLATRQRDDARAQTELAVAAALHEAAQQIRYLNLPGLAPVAQLVDDLTPTAARERLEELEADSKRVVEARQAVMALQVHHLQCPDCTSHCDEARPLWANLAVLDAARAAHEEPNNE